MNIREFLNQVRANEGGSYNLNTGEFNPNQGYMVSLAEHEYRSSEFDEDTLLKYIAGKARYLAEIDNYVGVWKDESGAWCFDVSQNIYDKVEATEAGLSRRQEAIWDCAKGEAIFLKDGGPKDGEVN